MRKVIGIGETVLDIIFKGGKPQENRLVEVKTPGELKAFIEEGLKD